MQINQAVTPILTLQEKLLILAKLMESCTLSEECVNILLADSNYRIAYSRQDLTDFEEYALYYFIRSRIAFFQKDFIWFQKETLDLINICLENEFLAQFHFGMLQPQQIIQLFSFGELDTNLSCTKLFQKKFSGDKIPLHSSFRKQLLKLKKEKERHIQILKIGLKTDPTSNFQKLFITNTLNIFQPNEIVKYLD